MEFSSHDGNTSERRGKEKGKEKGEGRKAMGSCKESPSAGGNSIFAVRHAMCSLVFRV